MACYVYECPAHGRFEVHCPIRDMTRERDCPDCGFPAQKVVVSPQILIPAHFRTTLPTTGLKTGDGRSGEFENLKRDFNRWDSGASGIRDKKPPRERKITSYAKGD